jgi:hypothetical protein
MVHWMGAGGANGPTGLPPRGPPYPRQSRAEQRQAIRLRDASRRRRRDLEQEILRAGSSQFSWADRYVGKDIEEGRKRALISLPTLCGAGPTIEVKGRELVVQSFPGLQEIEHISVRQGEAVDCIELQSSRQHRISGDVEPTVGAPCGATQQDLQQAVGVLGVVSCDRQRAGPVSGQYRSVVGHIGAKLPRALYGCLIGEREARACDC